MTVQRSYKLRVYGNSTKADTAKYCSNRYNHYVNGFLGHLFFNNNQSFSTAGLGQLANQAQHKAKGIIKAQYEAQKETKAKVNVPEFKKLCCPCIIEKSKSKYFDYWVSISNQLTKSGVVKLPAKSHKALKDALREGWTPSKYGEFFQKNGKYYVLIFVSKEVLKAKPKHSTVGCDVGVKHSVVTSEGYIGKGLSTVIRAFKLRQAERRRQGQKVSAKVKTQIKQVLDREAQVIVRRSKNTGVSLVVEDPKRLANLRSGTLQGWARSYFANRCSVLGQEQSVFVLAINPAYTSQTCAKCGHRNKGSRLTRDAFECVACGFTAHADHNAACVISLKGKEILGKIISKKSGAWTVDEPDASLAFKVPDGI